MKWKRLGQIFSPQNYSLPLDCHDFAQSPQALVLTDRIRIYFSTRCIDKSNGKFLSHVAYVDMDKKLKTILGTSSNPVIPLGDLGCFDEHGIFPFSPFQDGNKITAYTCGWSRRKSVSVETATGYAESFDNGQTFIKLGTGQIFGATLTQPFLVGDSFVRKYNNQYHMWYMFGQKWIQQNKESAPDRVYKIGHAASNDGLNWTPEPHAIISDVLHENECQALPSVIYHGGLYHMFFCYRDVFGFRTDKTKGYRLGYAYSFDLINWTRDDQSGGMGLLTDAMAWDSDMLCYPHIFECDDHIYLLYNGNDFGRNGFGAAVLQSNYHYKINTSDAQNIKSHFLSCDKNFLNDLSSRINLDDYIQKLVEKSVRYEAWENDRLVGLLAVYRQNPQSPDADFITNMTVSETHAGQKVASHLLSYCISQTQNTEIRLEVGKDNHRAMNLYKKFGFKQSREGLKSFHLTLIIGQK